MKKFNTSLTRIKDQNGDFIPFDAIRGESIYDIAVRYGYVGTEEDMIKEIMSNGWIATCAKLETEKASIEYVDTEVAGIYDWKILADETFDLEWTGSSGVHVSERTVTLNDDLRNYKEFYVLYSPGTSDKYTGTTNTGLVLKISIDDAWYSLDYVAHQHSDAEPDNAYVASSVRQILTLPEGSTIISPCMNRSDSSDNGYDQVCVPATYNEIRVMQCNPTHNLTSASISGLRIIVVAR